MTLVETDPLVVAQHAAAESTPTERTRVEILNGMVIVNPPPSHEHSDLTEQLGDLFKDRTPTGMQVNRTGLGVFLRDDSQSTYQEPDVAIYRPPAGRRVTGSEVESVIEVVSPANRQQHGNRYGTFVVDRASHYGIPWVLIVDPASQTTRWWHDGSECDGGPDWAADLDVAAELWS